MKPVRQSLTRLKLPDIRDSPVAPDEAAPEHESPFTGVLKRLKRAEAGTMEISRFERIISACFINRLMAITPERNFINL